MVILLEVLLLLGVVVIILGFLLFHKKLSVALSISVKNSVGILKGIALNLHIAFGQMSIFTMLILPLHEHVRSLCLLGFSSISFFGNVKFL